jgi:hypothetical protein
VEGSIGEGQQGNVVGNGGHAIDRKAPWQIPDDNANG